MGSYMGSSSFGVTHHVESSFAHLPHLRDPGDPGLGAHAVTFVSPQDRTSGVFAKWK